MYELQIKSYHSEPRAFRPFFSSFREIYENLSKNCPYPPTPNPPKNVRGFGISIAQTKVQALKNVITRPDFSFFGPGVKLQAVKKSRQIAKINFCGFIFTSKYVQNTSKCVHTFQGSRTDPLEAISAPKPLSI